MKGTTMRHHCKNMESRFLILRQSSDNRQPEYEPRFSGVDRDERLNGGLCTQKIFISRFPGAFRPLCVTATSERLAEGAPSNSGGLFGADGLGPCQFK